MPTIIRAPKTLPLHPLGDTKLQERLARARAQNANTRPDGWGTFRFLKRHADLVIAVVRSEPLLIGGSAVCRSAGHCAGAALFFAVGTPNSQINPDLHKTETKYRRLVFDTFRIDYAALEGIINANDTNIVDEIVVYRGQSYNQPSIQVQRSRRQEVIDCVRAMVGNTVRFDWDEDE